MSWRPCAPCAQEMSRWLDTRPSTLIPRPGFAHGSGAPYDVMVPDAAEAQARFNARAI